jgi:hypothetical protein
MDHNCRRGIQVERAEELAHCGRENQVERVARVEELVHCGRGIQVVRVEELAHCERGIQVGKVARVEELVHCGRETQEASRLG